MSVITLQLLLPGYFIVFILIWWGFPLWTTRPLILPVISKQELVWSRPSPRWWLLRVAAQLSDVWQGKGASGARPEGSGAQQAALFQALWSFSLKKLLVVHRCTQRSQPVLSAPGPFVLTGLCEERKVPSVRCAHTTLTFIFILKCLKSRTCIRIPWEVWKILRPGLHPRWAMSKSLGVELRYPYSLTVPPLFWSRARIEKHCFKANFYFLYSTQMPLFPVFMVKPT